MPLITITYNSQEPSKDQIVKMTECFANTIGKPADRVIGMGTVIFILNKINTEKFYLY